jgi:hypothetical protein
MMSPDSSADITLVVNIGYCVSCSSFGEYLKVEGR